MEYHSGALVHATFTRLAVLDRLQLRFLQHLGISEIDAFMHFSFAPPSLRRDIAVQGLLHKRVIGLAHPSFSELFPFAENPPGDRSG